MWIESSVSNCARVAGPTSQHSFDDPRVTHTFQLFFPRYSDCSLLDGLFFLFRQLGHGAHEWRALHDGIITIPASPILVVFDSSLRARDNVRRVYGSWFLRVLLVVEIEQHTAAN
jgi:hypothetical protein